jgi:hypothetical protein
MRSDVPTPIVIARRLAGAIFLVSLIIVLIGIALLANWYRTRSVAIVGPPPAPASTQSGTVPNSSPPSSSQSKPPRQPTSAERERSALSQLKKQAARDLATTDFDGQWAAQLSSKYVGTKDTRQVTASGSHIFKAVDILAEHNALRKKFSGGHEVLLLRGQDFHPHKSPKGRTVWYTFVLGSFSSANDIRNFCAFAYPDLSGDVLQNRCRPRTLRR